MGNTSSQYSASDSHGQIIYRKLDSCASLVMQHAFPQKSSKQTKMGKAF